MRADFSAATVEKVERLLEVLAALADDPLLRSVFVLHGGTALNVFSDEVPRLSVDVDLMYVGEADVAAMKAARPATDKRLREVLGKLGYTVRGTNDEHSVPDLPAAIWGRVPQGRCELPRSGDHA